MSTILQIAPDETVLLNIQFQPSPHLEPFHFAVSNEAVYVPAKRIFASVAPSGCRRVPLAQVREVSVRNVRPARAWAWSITIISVGLALGATGFTTATGATLERFLAWTLALIACGALLPWAAKGQQQLTVAWTKGVYRWNPPSGGIRASKQQAQNTLESILDTCRAVGLSVSYEAEPDVQRLV